MENLSSTIQFLSNSFHQQNITVYYSCILICQRGLSYKSEKVNFFCLKKDQKKSPVIHKRVLIIVNNVGFLKQREFRVKVRISLGLGLVLG